MTAIATALAAFAVDSGSESIPADVRERARLHLLDTLGCGLAAVGLGAAPQASAIAARQGGAPQASLLGEEARVPAALAALANGTRCHGLDFDDTHEQGICHSSTVIAPAALAAGEAAGASGRAVIDAFVLGTEVALRIAIAAAEGLYARGFHPTSICGAFGAAAAAARLGGRSAAEAQSALGIVGSFASGLFEYLSDGSATKPLHAGWAAQAGIQAALLAAAGASGPATVIEGRFGLLRSHAGPDLDAASILAGLGERWELESIAFKPYPACHFTHAPTWAAAELAAEHDLAPDDVAEATVRVPPEGEALVLEPLAAKHTPASAYDAKFSLPFTVAHQLVHGSLGLTSFTPEWIGEPRVLELAARIGREPLGEDERGSRFAGGIRITTADGRELDRFLPDPPGSPHNPLDGERLRSKFEANAALALPPERAGEVERAIAGLDEAGSVAELGRLLALARPGGAG